VSIDVVIKIDETDLILTVICVSIPVIHTFIVML